MVTSEHLTKYLEETSQIDLSHEADTRPTQSIETARKKPSSTLRNGHHIVQGTDGREDMGEYIQGLVALEKDAGRMDFETALEQMRESEYINQSPPRPKS